ncbi:MAG: hypothetical protein KDA99_21480 [Planctomycetales bacterium]|nr:hypothetical protein [Planctomycetales bacterium]
MAVYPSYPSYPAHRSTGVYVRPQPNGGWSDNQGGWGTSWSSVTVDPNGQNSVYSIGGEVLAPPN